MEKIKFTARFNEPIYPNRVREVVRTLYALHIAQAQCIAKSIAIKNNWAVKSVGASS